MLNYAPLWPLLHAVFFPEFALFLVWVFFCYHQISYVMYLINRHCLKYFSDYILGRRIFCGLTTRQEVRKFLFSSKLCHWPCNLLKTREFLPKSPTIDVASWAILLLATQGALAQMLSGSGSYFQHCINETGLEKINQSGAENNCPSQQSCPPTRANGNDSGKVL